MLVSAVLSAPPFLARRPKVGRGATAAGQGWAPRRTGVFGGVPPGDIGDRPRCSLQPPSCVVYREPAAPKALRRGATGVGSATQIPALQEGSPLTQGQVGEIAVSPVLMTM